MKKLVNLTNHPYSGWDAEQTKAARAFGECVDMPFPVVDPEAGTEEIQALAEDFMNRIIALDGELTVHIMGEQTFCYALISLLLKRGIRCIASCTSRDVTILPDGSKQVRFHFSRFRDYATGF